MKHRIIWNSVAAATSLACAGLASTVSPIFWAALVVSIACWAMFALVLDHYGPPDAYSDELPDFKLPVLNGRNLAIGWAAFFVVVAMVWPGLTMFVGLLAFVWCLSYFMWRLTSTKHPAVQSRRAY